MSHYYTSFVVTEHTIPVSHVILLIANHIVCLLLRVYHRTSSFPHPERRRRRSEIRKIRGRLPLLSPGATMGPFPDLYSYVRTARRQPQEQGRCALSDAENPEER